MNNPIFNKGKEKIFECFYKHRQEPLYFSQILRETKLTQNTTLRHLKNLENIQIISSKKDIAHTYYQITKNPIVYSIFSYFDYRQFNEHPKKKAISDFIDSIKKPLIAYLIDSTSLLLIYNEKVKKAKGFQTFIIPYDYFVKNVNTSTIAKAIKKGFVITGHHYFYKAVLV